MSTTSRSDDSLLGNVNPFRKLFKREDGAADQSDQALRESAAAGAKPAKKKQDDQDSLMRCFPGCGCEPNEWKE